MECSKAAMRSQQAKRTCDNYGTVWKDFSPRLEARVEHAPSRRAQLDVARACHESDAPHCGEICQPQRKLGQAVHQ